MSETKGATVTLGGDRRCCVTTANKSSYLNPGLASKPVTQLSGTTTVWDNKLKMDYLKHNMLQEELSGVEWVE